MDLPKVLTSTEDESVKNNKEEEEGAQAESETQGNTTTTTNTTTTSNKGANNDDNNEKKEQNENDDEGEDTSSTDVDVDNYDDDDEDKGVSPEEAERLLLEAANLKEQGNQHFSQTTTGGDEKQSAIRCYRRGLHRLKKLRRGGPSADEQVQALWVTLSTNLATALWQTKQYSAAAAAATQALQVQPMHVKALYRRAVARKQLGDTDQAMADLQTALVVEPNHAACRKELRVMQQAQARAKQQQKKAYAAAFASGTGLSLYDDKQQPPKEQPTPEELEQQRRALERDKQKWEDECVARMARGEDAISFDDWQKEQQKKLEKERQEEQERQKAERKRLQEERRQARAAAKNNHDSSSSSDSDGDDEKLTEAELQALRGYKKTKDGRVTSYFTRELSPEEQAKLAAAQSGPQKLSSTTGTTSATASVAAAPTSGNAMAGPSAWNRAGTWEEKNTTEWCREHLRACLLRVRTATTHICKVDQCTGDASVVWTQGQQRFVYDFHVTLQYAWTAESEMVADAAAADTDQDKPTSTTAHKAKRAKGIVKLPDISSTSTQGEQGVEVLFESGWKRSPATAQAQQQALADRPALQRALQDAVQQWLRDFHQQYRSE